MKSDTKPQPHLADEASDLARLLNDFLPAIKAEARANRTPAQNTAHRARICQLNTLTDRIRAAETGSQFHPDRLPAWLALVDATLATVNERIVIASEAVPHVEADEATAAQRAPRFGAKLAEIDTAIASLQAALQSGPATANAAMVEAIGSGNDASIKVAEKLVQTALTDATKRQAELATLTVQRAAMAQAHTDALTALQTSQATTYTARNAVARLQADAAGLAYQKQALMLCAAAVPYLRLCDLAGRRDIDDDKLSIPFPPAGPLNDLVSMDLGGMVGASVVKAMMKAIEAPTVAQVLAEVEAAAPFVLPPDKFIPSELSSLPPRVPAPMHIALSRGLQ